MNDRIPVRQIGKGDPGGSPQHMHPNVLVEQFATNDLYAKLMMNPQMVANADPMVMELLNQVRMAQIELAALRQLLLTGHVVHAGDLQQSRVDTAAAADAELQRIIAGIGKRFQQAPPSSGGPG